MKEEDEGRARRNFWQATTGMTVVACNITVQVQDRTEGQVHIC